MALFCLLCSYCVHFVPSQSTSVLFNPLNLLWSYSVQFILIRSILSTLILFNLIRSTSVLLGPHWSYLVLFSPLHPHWFYSVQFGPNWSPEVHFGLIQFIMSTWSYSVLLGPFRFYSVYFGPHLFLFGPLQFYSVHIGIIWSYLVQYVHIVTIGSNLVLLSPPWSYSVLFDPLRSYLVHFNSIRSILVLCGPIQSILSTLFLIRSTSVHFSPIQYFRPIWFTLVLFRPLCPLWSYSIIFGSLWSYFVHFGPILDWRKGSE